MYMVYKSFAIGSMKNKYCVDYSVLTKALSFSASTSPVVHQNA